MDSQKLGIIILVVVIIVFVIFAARGGLTNDQPEPFSPDQAKKNAPNANKPDWTKTIDKVFGSIRETVDLSCEKTAKGTERRCEMLSLGNSDVKAAKDPWLPFMKKATFRTAKLVLLKGQAMVLYIDRKGGDKIDNPQKLPLPNPDDHNSAEGSLVMLENGGTLNITCVGTVPCQVGQE